MTFSIADSLWVFLAAILVFFMNLGFACVEAGFARAKNTVNILSKNFIDFAVSSLGFLLLGWGLMFGGDGPVLGTGHLFILGSQDLSFYDDTLTASVPFWGKFFFQLVFCGTAATIVSGAVAERVKYISFTLFSFVLTLVIYPIVGHWIWGGGWLAGLGMTVNGCLAGLVGITGGCAYVSVASSLLIGALAGVLVVFAVLFFDRIHVDDPVGATSVHLCCGVFGTLCIGLFAQEGVTTLSVRNGLFFGGGTSLLLTQLIGVLAVGAFAMGASALVWLVLKHTVGIRVTAQEEIRGLDIGEHGNVAYPDFSPAAVSLSASEGTAAPAVSAVSRDAAVPVVHCESPRAKITKVTILANQSRFGQLQDALEGLGITGITVTNVFGYGAQKGHEIYFRGSPVSSRLLPKLKIDIVICKIPTEILVKTVQDTLYTGHVGDGKIFLYDVEDVVKIRTGERGYDALRDEDTGAG